MNIFVIGNTGAGKTTFIKQLIDKHNKQPDNDYWTWENKYKMIEDSYDDKKYLKDFYNSPFQFAYPNEMFYMLRSIQDLALVNYGREAEHIIFDRSILDIYVFVEALNKVGMLQDEEDHKKYTIMKRYMDLTLELFLREIDLVVFLRSDFDSLIKNINKRGRNAEVENLYQDDLHRLAMQLNLEMDEFTRMLKLKYRINVLTFDNLSKLNIDSVEYQKVVDTVHLIAESL